MRLEQRLEAIDRRLMELSRFTMHTGAGPIGYRSASQPETKRREWVTIDLGEVLTIDEIVIVPTIYRTADSELRADGFPEEFRVVVGTRESPKGMTVAAFTAADKLLPRLAPVVIPCDVRASWVRVEATVLSPRAWDGKYVLQLSEVFVFSRGENVALRRPVRASSAFESDAASRHTRFLVDGVTPYLMDAAEGEQSAAFLTTLDEPEPVALTIDLGSERSLTGILLHAIDLSDNIPQAHESTFGIPRAMLIEAASDPTFKDARTLCEYRIESTLDAGPIVALRFPETSGRYVRLTVVEPGLARSDGKPVFGFAEIECLSAGRNVARGAPVTMANIVQERDVSRRSLSAITDGQTFYGRILPLRDWLGELAERHDLETERPAVQALLETRYRLRGELATLLLWVCGALAGLVALSFAVEAYFRRRAIAHTRAQIAADLHDELGANLYAIALCSDLAKSNQSSVGRIMALLDEMRALAHRSGAAVRSCVTMLESQGLHDGLATDMRRTTRRLLADIEHRLEIESEDRMAALPTKIQVGLGLFYKECLTNILRHSGATQVMAHLTLEDGMLRLSVADNGRVLSDSATGLGGATTVPASLRRRARLMGGRVSAHVSPAGGITIMLRVTTIPWWRTAWGFIHGHSNTARPRHADRG